MFEKEEINVLYIEDNKQLANLIVKYLKDDKHIKFNIVHKQTLKSSLEYLQNSNLHKTDVILMDLILPNSKGAETYLRLKKGSGCLPTVIISGYEDLACECVKLGAQDYLYKPEVTPGLLVRSLKYAIERKLVEEELRASEKRFRNLVEVTKAGIYEIDFVNNKFIYVNDVICEKTGYTKEELMNMGPPDILSKDSTKEWRRRLKVLQSGGYVDSSVEYKIIKKDGSEIWVLLTAEYIEDKNNNVIGANVVSIDINNTKVMQSKLKEHEEKVYKELENKIHEWQEEKKQKYIKLDNQLNIINEEINLMIPVER